MPEPRTVRTSTSSTSSITSVPAPQAFAPSQAAFALPADDQLRDLLSRSAFERTREYRYRFGQSVVFGLPVVALQFWGFGLGGREAAKWVGVFQMLLAGWVVYVATAGMLFEGLLLLPRRVSADLVCAVIALAAYLLSLVKLLLVLFGGAAARPMFHVVVLIMGVWSAGRWWQYARRASKATLRP